MGTWLRNAKVNLRQNAKFAGCGRLKFSNYLVGCASLGEETQESCVHVPRQL